MSTLARSSLLDVPLRAQTALVVLLCAALSTAPTLAQLGPPLEPPGNPLTVSKANLGKVLFWDEQLSSTRTVSCGTCHIPAAGGEDPRSLEDPRAEHPGADGIFGNDDDVLGSPGVPQNDVSGLYLWNTHFGLTEQVTGRRTVSSINAGYAFELFWDGRAGNEFVDPVTKEVVLESGAALESQAVGPPLSDVEMAHIDRMWTEVLTRIEESEPLAVAHDVPAALHQWIAGRDYAELFDEAFGTPEINAGRVGMAIASYERTQFTAETPFDEFLAKGTPLTPQEEDGLVLMSTTGCSDCHTVPIMSDNDFHYTGVRPPDEDIGREEVTGLVEDRAKMRTPSLRNLELRAPYMHNGRFATIEEVVDFYDRGGDFDAPNKDPLIVPLSLTQEQKDALIAFLKRPLTDPRLAAELPPFDRPGLFTESDLVPVIDGAGVAGSGGFVPAVVALEPPLIGNPSFTVGVYEALGGADALLVIDDVDPGLTKPASGDFAFENITLGGGGAGEGFGSVSLTIPDDAGLGGSEWFGRWYVDDPGAGGTAVSQLFRFTVFQSWGQSAIFLDDFELGDASAW